MEGNRGEVDNLYRELVPQFLEFVSIQSKIMNVLTKYSDGKSLKGNEIVGHLGEIIVKLYYGGTLAPDSMEHDVDVPGGDRYSVKTRKGKGKGWNTTSTISKVDGPDCPTHLVFIQLGNDFSVFRAWRIPWDLLRKEDRFKPINVRGKDKGWCVKIKPTIDKGWIIDGLCSVA